MNTPKTQTMEERALEYCREIPRSRFSYETSLVSRDLITFAQSEIDLAQRSDSPKQIWTFEQVVELTHRQRDGKHPYTCGNKDNHPTLDGDMGILIPTIYGWICQFCDYRQNWSHETQPQPPKKG